MIDIETDNEIDNATGCKLKDLLPAELGDFEDAVERGLRNGEKPNHSRLAWRFIRSSAVDELRNALDCDLFGYLAQAWSKVRELREVKQQKGQTIIVHLHKHDFPLEVHPVIVVRVGGMPALSLRFTLQVQARFNAAALSIRDGFITSVAPGDASVTAQLMYGEVKLHKEQASSKVKLRGRYRFKSPGIRIG